MLELYNVRKKPSNVKKNKGTTKCDKRTVTCDVGTAQCEDGIVKCEKKYGNHQIWQKNCHMLFKCDKKNSHMWY